MRLIRVRGDSGPVRVEYVAPPVPDPVEPADGEAVIEIAEQKGIPETVLTYENGMTVHLYRERHDWGAAERYVECIELFLVGEEYANDVFLGFPPAAMPQESVWIPKETLHKLFNLHDNVSLSPLAESKVGRGGGQRILVPMGNDLAQIPAHGPGKRRR